MLRESTDGFHKLGYQSTNLAQAWSESANDNSRVNSRRYDRDTGTIGA